MAALTLSFPFDDSSTHGHRRYLGINKAPTRLAGTDHVCSYDSDIARDKAQRRISGIFIRYAFTELLGCRTTRGSTALQTGQSHCGNCACAHWASAPTLQDDKMARTISDIKQEKELSPQRKSYLARRMNLSSPEKKEFENLTSEKKENLIRERLSPQSLKSSFSRTAYAEQLSSTLEGPIASNHFDSIIERRIWELEQRLSDQVSEKVFTYQQATQITYEHIVRMLQVSVQNLEIRMKQLERYFLCEQQLDEMENKYAETQTMTLDDAILYAYAAEELVGMRKALTEPLEFSPGLTAQRFAEMTHRRDFFWFRAYLQVLSELADENDLLKETIAHLGSIQKISYTADNPIIEETRLRLQEAKGQLEGMLSFGLCNVNKLPLLLFGLYEKDSVRRAPSREELTTQLIDMTARDKNF